MTLHTIPPNAPHQQKLDSSLQESPGEHLLTVTKLNMNNNNNKNPNYSIDNNTNINNNNKLNININNNSSFEERQMNILYWPQLNTNSYNNTN